MTPDDIVSIFARILEDPAVDENSDFFEAGGDSLLATRVISAIARKQGVELTIDEFVEAPTPARLAGRIATVTA